MSDPSRERVQLDPPIRTELHELRLLAGTGAILRTIEEAVDAARKRVLVETYIYRNDKLGVAIGERLARAAERGLDVRLLYDPLGSQETSAKIFDALAARRVRVRPYRLPGRHTIRPFPRDHGRVIVVDDQAWTGGAAWGEEWLPVHRGGGGWWDVCAQVLSGPVVSDFAKLFEMRWNEAEGGEEPCDYETGDKYPDVALVADCPAQKSLVFDRHVDRIRRATTRVWIENAYFFPPLPLLRALVDAAQRGVDVKVIVPAESDLPIVERAARAEYRGWLRHGVRIFEYRDRMMHAKYAVIDDDWCTVGTFNANPTSVAMANEVNLVVTHRAFVARAAEQFTADLQRSEEISLDNLGHRRIFGRVVDRLAADVLALADAVFGPRRSRVGERPSSG